MTFTPRTTVTPPAPRAGRGRHPALALAICAALAIGTAPGAVAQVSIGLAMPGINIGINVPVYPDFEQMPGYPVYYAPSLDMNMFFYDGLYWNYVGDQWYSSSWYNGPWDLIGREYVPLFVLRIPVRYYRRPPDYFRGWAGDEPPRWGDRWGREWQQRREGWDRWDHRSPPAAPLPLYQREFRGSRYPQQEQQRTLRDQHYQYRPQDAVVRQHFDATPNRQDRGRDNAPRSDRPAAAGDRARPADRPNPGTMDRAAKPPASGESSPRNASPDRRPEAQRTDRPPPSQATDRTPAQRDPALRGQAQDRSATPQRITSPDRMPTQDRRVEPQRAAPPTPNKPPAAPPAQRSQPPERRQEAPRPEAQAQPRSRPEPAAAPQRPERPASPPGRAPDKRDEGSPRGQ